MLTSKRDTGRELAFPSPETQQFGSMEWAKLEREDSNLNKDKDPYESLHLNTGHLFPRNQFLCAEQFSHWCSHRTRGQEGEVRDAVTLLSPHPPPLATHLPISTTSTPCFPQQLPRQN